MKEPREPIGLAWLPILILPDGSVEEPSAEESLLGILADLRELRE